MGMNYIKLCIVLFIFQKLKKNVKSDKKHKKYLKCWINVHDVFVSWKIFRMGYIRKSIRNKVLILLLRQGYNLAYLESCSFTMCLGCQLKYSQDGVSYLFCISILVIYFLSVFIL